MILPTADQLRMARAALDLPLRGPADPNNPTKYLGIAGVSAPALNQIESGKSSPRLDTVQRLVTYYVEHGVEFGPDGWVRIKP